MYDTFEQFLQTGIREYYGRGQGANRTRLVALLIVSGEAVPLALDALGELLTPGRLAAGALGALALRVGLRWVVSGPLGLVLTGLGAASLVTYYFAHQQEIGQELAQVRRAVDQARQGYRSIQERAASGRFDTEERNLMIDGLLQRFLRDLDQAEATVG